MALETQGTLLYWSTSTAASTSTSAVVTGIQSISGPQSANSEIDITDFNSTAKEFLLGLVDNGSLTVEMLHDTSNTGQTNMKADQLTRSRRKVVIDLSGTTVAGNRLEFDAYVSGWSYNIATDDAVKVSATLRITGAIDTTNPAT